MLKDNNNRDRETDRDRDMSGSVPGGHKPNTVYTFPPFIYICTCAMHHTDLQDFSAYSLYLNDDNR